MKTDITIHLRRALRPGFTGLGISRAGAALLVWALAALAPGTGTGAEPAAKFPWQDNRLSPDQRTKLVLQQMTLDEKVALVHGVDRNRPGNDLKAAGYAAGVPRLGIPEVQSTDGRSGVGNNAGARGRYATALPSALALSATWDLRLAHEFGEVLGRECRQLGFQISLGATANLVREPRCGRNFECLGEEPLLIGKMLARELNGTHAQGVVANINRFAFNDQETSRGVYNVVMDKRTMRETDLLAFEIAIKESEVGTVMGAYNRLNGEYCCENRYLLNDVLKRDWHFKGWVMSDWGGTHSTAKAVLAGFDQEMPGDGYLGEALKRAVETGAVPMARLDDMVSRILRAEFAAGVLDRTPGAFPPMSAVNPFAGAEVAQRVAEAAMVLLKNAQGQLPLDAARLASIAVIGSHADAGVLSGGGSDQVDAAGGNAVPGARAVWHPSSPLEAIRARAPKAKVEYDAGTNAAAAARLAAASEVAVVFAHQHTSEGSDVPNLSLPERQDQLVEAVAAANPRTIVVLETGGPVTMPWLGSVRAVLEAWYPGIRGGQAIANVLFGDVNPSGKLTVTFPKTEADLPQVKLPAPPPEPFDLHYAEGLKVGYKWFDAEGKEPLFPFGSGLSYTTFTYSDLKIPIGDKTAPVHLTATNAYWAWRELERREWGGVQVTFQVANTGNRPGSETVQVYASLPPAAAEPPKRLLGWEKIQLAPGQTRRVSLMIDPWRLSVFNPDKDEWKVVPGQCVILVGPSSRSTPLRQSITL
jgi:beta-glucosidase